MVGIDVGVPAPSSDMDDTEREEGGMDDPAEAEVEAGPRELFDPPDPPSSPEPDEPEPDPPEPDPDPERAPDPVAETVETEAVDPPGTVVGDGPNGRVVL